MKSVVMMGLIDWVYQSTPTLDEDRMMYCVPCLSVLQCSVLGTAISEMRIQASNIDLVYCSFTDNISIKITSAIYVTCVVIDEGEVENLWTGHGTLRVFYNEKKGVTI
jgi:hypothetical protein